MSFFLLCEIILDVKGLPDLLWGLAFDHVSNRLAGYVQQSFDIQIVCSQNQFKECALVNLKELLVPNWDIICSFLPVLVVLRGRRIIFVVCAPLDDLNDIYTKK